MVQWISLFFFFFSDVWSHDFFSLHGIDDDRWWWMIDDHTLHQPPSWLIICFLNVFMVNCLIHFPYGDGWKAVIWHFLCPEKFWGINIQLPTPAMTNKNSYTISAGFFPGSSWWNDQEKPYGWCRLIIARVTKLVGGLVDIFYFSRNIGNNHPNWLIFFRGVQTTNQKSIGLALVKSERQKLPIFSEESASQLVQLFSTQKHMEVSWGYPHNWCRIDNSIEMDEHWGYPHLRKPPNHH